MIAGLEHLRQVAAKHFMRSYYAIRRELPRCPGLLAVFPASENDQGESRDPRGTNCNCQEGRALNIGQALHLAVPIVST